MKIKDILYHVDANSVLSELRSKWDSPKKNEEGYREVIGELLGMAPKNSNFTVHVKLENDGEYGEWIHVFGTRSGGDETWALGLAPWAEWLGYEVDSELPDELVIAGALYEMTYYGFHESKVQSVRENLEKMAGEFDGSDDAASM